ncbi:MAG: dephospho-CoA kinase [Spirochaetales bacterium]|nr:dephospho-CoA kinase [Spirochaetales bacterium]
MEGKAGMVRYPKLPALVWSRSRFLIGLTGAIGSGKSTAAGCFRRAGATVLDADQMAREQLHNAALRPSLAELFGPEIFDEAGEVSREALARRVFHKPEQLEKLNQLLHPRVRAGFQAAVAKTPSGSVIAYDIPLLFETGAEEQFDLTVVISAPRELRLQRATTRSGWDEAEFERRERQQLPLSEKEKRADLVIENTQTQEVLCQTIEELCAAIRRAAPDGRTEA